MGLSCSKGSATIGERTTPSVSTDTSGTPDKTGTKIVEPAAGVPSNKKQRKKVLRAAEQARRAAIVDALLERKHHDKAVMDANFAACNLNLPPVSTPSNSPKIPSVPAAQGPVSPVWIQIPATGFAPNAPVPMTAHWQVAEGPPEVKGTATTAVKSPFAAQRDGPDSRWPGVPPSIREDSSEGGSTPRSCVSGFTSKFAPEDDHTKSEFEALKSGSDESRGDGDTYEGNAMADAPGVDEEGAIDIEAHELKLESQNHLEGDASVEAERSLQSFGSCEAQKPEEQEIVEQLVLPDMTQREVHELPREEVHHLLQQEGQELPQEELLEPEDTPVETVEFELPQQENAMLEGKAEDEVDDAASDGAESVNELPSLDVQLSVA